MDYQLTILFCPINHLGHLNPLIGFGQLLVPKHRVVFALSQKTKGQLTKYGFEEEIYQVDDPFINMDKGYFKKKHEEQGIFKGIPTLDKMKKMKDENPFFKAAKLINPEIKEIVARVKPDLVVLDSMFILPAAIKNYPWICLITSNPNQCLRDENVPPSGFGKKIKQSHYITYLI